MAGLGAFIQGAFQGYEYGQQNKDRNTKRERDKERFEWERKRQDRLDEDWGWTQETRGRQREEWQRADDEREFFQDVYDDARETYDEGATVPTPRGVTPTQPEAAPDTDMPPVQGPVRPARSVVVDTTAPAQPVAPMAPASAGGATSLLIDDGPMPVQGPRQQNPAAFGSDPSFDRQMYRATPTQPVAPAPDTQMQPELVGPPQSFIDNPPQAALELGGGDVNRAWRMMPERARRYWLDAHGNTSESNIAVTTAGRGVQGPSVVQDVSPGFAPSQIDRAPRSVRPAQPEQPGGGQFVLQGLGYNDTRSPQPPRADTTPAVRPGASGARPTVGATPVEAATTEQLDQQATQAPPDQGGSPSVESASVAIEETAATSRGVVGEGTGKVRPEDERRVTKSFMDHYTETAVPKIIDYYLSRGEIEKAEAFEEYARSKKTRGQLESWSKAAWAATVGDEAAFEDNLEATYNAINDGYSIDRKQTFFKKDGNGNIIGAQLAVVNEETGEVSIQEFDNTQDIVEMAIFALSPEQTFEYLWGLSEQAREMQIKAAGGGEQITQKEIGDAIGTEFRALWRAQEDNFMNEAPKQSREEIERQATINVYRRYGLPVPSYMLGNTTSQGQEPAPLR